MSYFTIEQWAILFLVLVLGWLLGLLSRSGGAKWRRAYEDEHAERLALEHRHAEDIAARDAANATRDRHVAELERAAAARPVAPVAAPVPATPRRDDLALIRGVGQPGAERLAAAGVHDYATIRALDAAAAADLETRVGAAAGTIDRDHWREQAALLDDGQIDEHRERYG